MIDLGMVIPGKTIRIPFGSYDGGTGASLVASALIAGDIEIYKDGNTTARASTSGYVATVTFNSTTGIHLITIDLADNGTTGFFVAGSEYFVILGPFTVDAQTVNMALARFEIGYADAILNTGIASLTSATQFIIDAGPAEADVLIGCPVLIHDVASKVQFAFGVVSDYIVSTKEVFLAATPVGFTPVATDSVSFFMPTDLHSVKGTVQTAGDIAALIVTADSVVDAIKLETDKLTLGDAGAGQTGSIIEEIENRPTTAMRGTDNVVLAGPTKAEMDTGHGLLATEAKQDIIDGIVDEIKAATIIASGLVESSGSNSDTQVQTNLAEASNDHYLDMTILFLDGDEAGQSRLITGYTGSTGVVAWNEATIGTPADGVAFVLLAAGTTADAVWDEILTGNSHNINTSAGRRLRELEESFVQASGTIATVTNGHTFTLDTGAVATADYYPHSRLTITEGTGAGQSRLIINYTVGRVCTLESDFTTNPDTSSLYSIEAADSNMVSTSNNAVQGFIAVYTNTTTFTLDSLALATGDIYIGDLIHFHHGAGNGQTRHITGYTSGRVVTVSPPLITALDTTTTYLITSANDPRELADQVWDEPMAGHVTADTAGLVMNELQNGGRLDLLIDAILADTNSLNDGSQAEPAGVPPASASLITKVGFLYMVLRNQVTVTASKKTFHDDAGNPEFEKDLSDDATTYTETEANAI